MELQPQNLPHNLCHSNSAPLVTLFTSSQQSYGNQLKDNKSMLPRVDVQCHAVCGGLRLLVDSAFSASWRVSDTRDPL